jgi:hypothetical protein
VKAHLWRDAAPLGDDERDETPQRTTRDHPPMLIDYQSTTTKQIVRTVCECCGDDVAIGRAATRAEQDAHALSCKGAACTSRHDGSKDGAK